MKNLKKTVFTLNVNDYAPEIRAITYPLLKYWAHKIGAEFFEINVRRFPEWPVPYEKFQIYFLAQEMENDWNIYLDADTLVHPGTPDWTLYLGKDTIAQHGSDVASIRLRYNQYMMRDGRNYGSAGWFTIASDWCLDLWHPAIITPEEAINSCFPTHQEANAGIKAEHLVDDYIMSSNIARFGLKTKKLTDLRKQIGLGDLALHSHAFMMSNEEKVRLLTEIVTNWEIPEYVRNYGKEEV